MTSGSGAAEAEQELLEVEGRHRLCKHDAECVRMVLECSCSCGMSVNRRFVGLYLEAKEKRCRDYSGPMCKMSCPGVERCISGICEVLREVKQPG
jgi:hypothetical protein